MTNPFKAFRQWRKERYYRESCLAFKFHAPIYMLGRLDAGVDISPSEIGAWIREQALSDTRVHFNDPTFEPRSKSK